jgi:hypothetical protein
MVDSYSSRCQKEGHPLCPPPSHDRYRCGFLHLNAPRCVDGRGGEGRGWGKCVGMIPFTAMVKPR